MSDSSRPVQKAVDNPPKPVEMAIRHLFGWIYIKALAWIRAAPVEKEHERCSRLAPYFRYSEDILAARNVPLVYGDDGIDRVKNGRFNYQVRLMCDIARMLHAGPKGILERVNVSGFEHLEAAMAGKKGVILVSAHAGTWFHAPAVAASRGLPVSSVLTRFLPGAIVRYFKQVARELNGVLTFVRMGAYEAARAAFKRGEVFFLSFDFASRLDRSIEVPVGEKGIFQLDTGPGIMAVRHQVPLVWVDTFHDESGKSCVRFHPAIHAGRGTEFPDAKSVLWYLMDRLNDQLASYPEQWWLLGHAVIHRRSDSMSPNDTGSNS